MSEEKPTNEVLITYHGEAGKIPISPVNGAYGGVDPYGEMIVANFFLEQLTVPVAETIPINAEGHGDPSKARSDKRSDIQRTIVATFTLTSGSARRIAEWLKDKADIIDGLKGKQ